MRRLALSAIAAEPWLVPGDLIVLKRRAMLVLTFMPGPLTDHVRLLGLGQTVPVARSFEVILRWFEAPDTFLLRSP